ncbi:MAG: hypothetical protein DRI88_12090, partial [Bacteroidetes bacterium]
SGVKEIHYIIDGVEHIAYGNVVINITGNDGWHNIEYYSIDNLGNEEQHHVATYYLDNTPPTTTIEPLIQFFKGNLTVYINATDIASGIKEIHYIINGIENVAYGNVVLNLTETAEIEYYSIDALGNEETHHFATYYLDEIPPVITPSFIGNTMNVTEEGREIVWISNLTLLEFTGDDGNGSGVKAIYYSIWGWNDSMGEWILVINDSYTSPISFAEHGYKEFLVQYNGEDNLGNIAPIKWVYVRVDSKAPVTTIEFESIKRMDGNVTVISNISHISFVAIDDDTGVAATYYRILNKDDGTGNWSGWMDYTTPFTMNFGNYSIEYYSIDNVGNEEQHHRVDIKVEAPPPEDVNMDGKVNGDDLKIVVMHWMENESSPNWNPRADVNGDGVVNIEDVKQIMLKWDD